MIPVSWLLDVFGTEKPVIGMVHFPALPGTPMYDERQGMDGIVASARRDLTALQDAGVSAVMFCNENDRPYTLAADPAVVAAMAAAIGQLRGEVKVPFGVDVLWDPRAAVALAAGTGARFVREIFTGVYDSDMGRWDTAVGEVARYRRLIGAQDVRLLYNIQAEFASPLGQRSVADLARSVVMSSVPDALCISGSMTGESVPLEMIERVKAVVKDTPVFANTGVNDANVADILALADGAIIGTYFKKGGITWNPVDQSRVARLMRAARGHMIEH